MQYDGRDASQLQEQQSQVSSGDIAGGVGGLGSAFFAQATCDRYVEFESLLARELPRFQRMAMRWLRNREDAEDAVQDALISAFRHIGSFEGRARMSSWIMAIVINSVKMRLRKAKRYDLPLDYVGEDNSLTVANTVPHPGPNPEQF